MLNWLKRLFKRKGAYKYTLNKEASEFDCPFHYTDEIEMFTYSPSPKYSRSK